MWWKVLLRSCSSECVEKRHWKKEEFNWTRIFWSSKRNGKSVSKYRKPGYVVHYTKESEEMESSLLAIMMWFQTASNRSRTIMTNLSDFNRETKNILLKCDFSPTLHRAKYMHVFVHACDTSEPQHETTTILGSLWRKRTQRILAVVILCATAATENIQRC